MDPTFARPVIRHPDERGDGPQPRSPLDVQLPGASRQPMRVVLDAQLSVAPTVRILAPPGHVLVLTESTDAARRGALERTGAEVEQVPASPQGLDLQAMLRRRAELEVNELQGECDAALAEALTARRTRGRARGLNC